MKETLRNIAIISIAMVCLPVVLPMVVFQKLRDARHQKKIVNEVSCESCGKLLGREALAESNRVVAEEREQFLKEHPGVRFRSIRSHDAICTECGREYFYSSHAKTYFPVDDD